MCDNNVHSNSYMARVGGIHSHELTLLELELCSRLRWRLQPSTNEIREAFKALTHPDESDWLTPWTILRRPPALQKQDRSRGRDPEVVHACMI